MKNKFKISLQINKTHIEVYEPEGAINLLNTKIHQFYFQT
jgi:hypothetical protein